jgi:NAD(P)-dependent dehydrogenase (short-subunit alcohol dehydrogenase family)
LTKELTCAASKAVLPAYARVWVSELKDRKIRVNVLTPGQVASPLLEEVMDEEMKAQFESMIPRGKMGSPEEIASVALFLASDDSSYVNGMELVVDGGMTVI